MECDKYWELLSARLDGFLSAEEEGELDAHLAVCPDCRAAGAQLAALQGAFSELEEGEAPEGFAQGVMDRIRAEEKPKVVPLFKRPQVRALAGLAACVALAIGLYGAALPQKGAEGGPALNSFRRNVQMGEEDGPQVNASPAGSEDAPQIAAYVAPGAQGLEKAAPNPAAEGLDGDSAYAEFVLTLDRMPEGGWELIPPEALVSPDGLTVSVELMEQLEQLALAQGINASRESGPEANDHCLIVILDEAK